MLWGDGKIAVTEKEIAKNLRLIHDDSFQKSHQQIAQQCVGVLTTDHRATWADLRCELKTQNEDKLRVVRIVFLFYTFLFVKLYIACLLCRVIWHNLDT